VVHGRQHQTVQICALDTWLHCWLGATRLSCAACLALRGAREGLAKRLTLQLKRHFPRLRGKELGCRPPRGVVLFGPIVAGDVVSMEKCFILRIPLLVSQSVTDRGWEIR